jgi:UDP-galactopyranose mutase
VGPRYYPINDVSNNTLHNKYQEELIKYPHVIGGGRLFNFRYMNMDAAVGSALVKAEKELK